MTRVICGSFLLSIVLGGCGAPQEPPPPDVRVLIRTSRYDEAIAEAERLVAQERTVQSLTVLATARAARSTMTDDSVDGAVEDLNQAVALGSRGEVAEAFAEEVTGSMAFTGGRLAAAASVMAALAQGWEGGGDGADMVRGASAFLVLAAYGVEQQAPEESLGPLVGAAAALLENGTNDFVFADGALNTAWVCFRSAGTITGATGGQIAAISAEICLRVAESNPQLSIAIACDLSSPRDRLRDSLMRAHDADGLARFSGVMEAAEGCSPGTYAP